MKEANASAKHFAAPRTFLTWPFVFEVVATRRASPEAEKKDQGGAPKRRPAIDRAVQNVCAVEGPEANNRTANVRLNTDATHRTRSRRKAFLRASISVWTDMVNRVV
jgi:hypothetical protein